MSGELILKLRRIKACDADAGCVNCGDATLLLRAIGKLREIADHDCVNAAREAADILQQIDGT